MHSLIVGVTGSGKTLLCKRQLVPYFKRLGRKVLVCEPFGERWDGADWQTTDPYELMAMMKRAFACVVFVDEAGEAIGQGKQARDLQWIATQSRHRRHLVHFITQRAHQIAPTIRDQCATGYVFRQSFDDARVLASQYADDQLTRAAQLPKGRFLFCRTCEPVREAQIVIPAR